MTAPAARPEEGGGARPDPASGRTSPTPAAPRTPASGLPHRVGRGLLVGAGLLCALLGLAGVFLPVLPTTPFLLLSAACFARGSERWHRRLREHPLLREHFERHRDGRGLSRAAKVRSILLLWATLGVSAFLVARTHATWALALLPCVGLGVTAYLLRPPPRAGR